MAASGAAQPPPAGGAGCTALFPLVPLLPAPARVRVADIGALSLGDGGDVWAPLLSQGLCDVVGFEPAPGECERLNEAAARRPAGSGQLRFFPTFVGDGQPGAQPLSARSGSSSSSSSGSSAADAAGSQGCSGSTPRR